MSDPRSLTNMMIRAARLDVDFYEEIEADTTATGQAFQAVIVASLASGLGYGLWAIHTQGLTWFIVGMILGVVMSIVGWIAWSGLAYLLGTTIFKGPETSATIGELLRTIGFSNSPRVLSVFSFIPVLGPMIAFIVSIWALIAGVIAVRQALDFSTWRAIGTCAVGWIIYMALLSVLQWVIL